MTKFLVALIIIVAAGGLFFYTQQTQAPAENANMQTEDTNPFGEGATVVGEIDDNGGREAENEIEGEDDDLPPGAEPPTKPAGEDTTVGTPTSGVISRAELAKHSTQQNCWVGYKGTVYDITNWLPRHPGSAGAIAPFCGKADEFAAAFNKQHGTGKDARLQKEGVKEGTLGN